MSNRGDEHLAVPTFLYVPFLNQNSGIEMRVRGWPTIGEIELMIEFLELSKRAALPDVPPDVFDTIAQVETEHSERLTSA